MRDPNRNDPDFMFTCCKCKIPKKNSEFNKKVDKRRFRQYSSICTICDGRRTLEWQRTSIIRKDWLLRNTFGITFEDWMKMHNNQKGRCLICNRTEQEIGRRFCVDHCHQTGKIRGLLCDNCNTGLGFFKDNIKLLKKAIKYLNK